MAPPDNLARRLPAGAPAPLAAISIQGIATGAMEYPQEFSTQARAQVEAERLKDGRELGQAQTSRPPTSWTWTISRWDECAFHIYILRMFLAFARAPSPASTRISSSEYRPDAAIGHLL